MSASGRTGRAGPRQSAPYPSGSSGLTDADVFRLVMCFQSPAEDNHVAGPPTLTASVGCSPASDLLRPGSRPLLQQPSTHDATTTTQSRDR